MEHPTPEKTGWLEDLDEADSLDPGPRFGHRQDAPTWFSGNGIPQTILLLTAVGTAWFPVENRPLTAVLLSLVVLGLSTWGWRRSSVAAIQSLGGSALILALLVSSGVSGWDPARAVGEISLIMAVAALAWIASRSRVPAAYPVLLALGLSALAVWGIRQAVVGLDSLLPGVESLPESMRAYAEERIAGRRGFASLPLPSHLAVLLATSLPLLVTRVKATPAGIVALLGVGLAMAGLVATRSPIGVALALSAVVAVFVGGNRRSALVVALLLALLLVTVVMARPDVARLEPVALRIDNWRMAMWMSESSPASGIGFSSFAQAGQDLPLVLGNRPAHAHNLPLEVLAELGPIGLAACVAGALALLRLIAQLWSRDRAMAVALAVIPLHNLVDFSFFVSGIAVPWAVLLGWAIGRCRESEIPSGRIRGRLALVVVAAGAVAGTMLHVTSIVVEEAAAAESRPVDRLNGALRALRLAPWRVEPQFLLAAVALEAEEIAFLDRAWGELDGHRWWRPRSAALAERRARVALARGDVSVAVSELWAAVERGYPESAREVALDELLVALEGKAHGPPD